MSEAACPTDFSLADQTGGVSPLRGLDAFFQAGPFALNRAEKRALLRPALQRLTARHAEKCAPYGRMLDGLGFDPGRAADLEDLPFLPVNLFKAGAEGLELKSVPEEEVVKILTSSGTSGQAVSRIYLDRDTAANQQKVLVKIVGDFLDGRTRRPLLIIDSPATVKDRLSFSARGAGILGFSIFGSDRVYALDEEMNLNLAAVEDFLERHQGRDFLLFGFTFMVWRHFYRALAALERKPDLSRGLLIHGGGWKKLASEAVAPEDFAKALKEVCGLERVHDYYGMAEQTGSIFMQCPAGHLHASLFSEVIIRRPADFAPLPPGRPGLIQSLSVLPESYPGHSLLTEDEGVLLGEDDCPCGRKGRYFKALGRIKQAEIRGCSDTYSLA